MKIIPRKDMVYSMDKGNQPVLVVDPPCELLFETNDCFNGQIQQEGTTISDLNFNQINPATGPVAINGLKRGDVLQVQIKEIEIDEKAIVVAAPGAGVLGDKVERPETIFLQLHGEEATFGEITLPVNKMIGVIGVAPDGEGISCGTPGPHGGNMDTVCITRGSQIYLPVFHSGALLAMGDLHAVMGDGEIMVSGAEVKGEVLVKVSRKSNLKLSNPLVETEEVVATIFSAESLDDAVAGSTRDMAQLLVEKTDLDLNRAGMLMSMVGQARICQVVDPLKTARFEMPQEILQQLGFTL